MSRQFSNEKEKQNLLKRVIRATRPREQVLLDKCFPTLTKHLPIARPEIVLLFMSSTDSLGKGSKK